LRRRLRVSLSWGEISKLEAKGDGDEREISVRLLGELWEEVDQVFWEDRLRRESKG
jgi:hypothetical protein